MIAGTPAYAGFQLASTMDVFLEHLPVCMIEVVADRINAVFATGGHTALMLSPDEISRRIELSRQRLTAQSGAPLPPAPPPRGKAFRVIDGGRCGRA